MSEKIEKPEIVTEDHLSYLVNLLTSGITGDMFPFEAGEYLINMFPELSKKEANTIVFYWMQIVSEGHSNRME